MRNHPKPNKLSRIAATPPPEQINPNNSLQLQPLRLVRRPTGVNPMGVRRHILDAAPIDEMHRRTMAVAAELAEQAAGIQLDTHTILDRKAGEGIGHFLDRRYPLGMGENDAVSPANQDFQHIEKLIGRIAEGRFNEIPGTPCQRQKLRRFPGAHGSFL